MRQSPVLREVQQHGWDIQLDLSWQQLRLEVSESDDNFLEELERTGKPPRGERNGKAASITLPKDPEALVEKLVTKLAPEVAGQVARLLETRLGNEEYIGEKGAAALVASATE